MRKSSLAAKAIIIALITIFASTYFLDDLRLANVFASGYGRYTCFFKKTA
jgi:hypothetical protein